MRISEIQGEAALDFLAEIMEPASVILADEDIKKAFRKGTKLEVATITIRKCKKELLQVLAAMNQTPLEAYKPNPFQIMKSAIDLFSDPGMKDFFYSPVQKTGAESSGSPLETTEDRHE